MLTLSNSICFYLSVTWNAMVFLSILWFILSIELTLGWNHVQDINEIKTTGQLIPFIIGCVSTCQILKQVALIGLRKVGDIGSCSPHSLLMKWNRCSRIGQVTSWRLHTLQGAVSSSASTIVHVTTRGFRRAQTRGWLWASPSGMLGLLSPARSRDGGWSYVGTMRP